MIFNISAIIPQLIGLLLFGIIFAVLVYWMDGKHEGYTSLLVVVGVAATVGSIGSVIGWTNVLYLLIAFAASGVPMIIGDIVRGIKHRNATDKAYRTTIKHLADRGIGNSEVADDETESIG